MPSAETLPSVTTRVTTVRMTRPSTSSATAAPSTVRASTDASARRSPNTRAVMPTLVAVSAAPTKTASSPENPSARPATAPVAIGTTTPTTATRIEARPTDRRSRRSISSPTSSRSRITPSSRERVDDLVRFDEPEHRRTDDDAGGDLGHDGRDVDAFGDLRGDLGRDEHDEDVEQDRVHVHRVRTPCTNGSAAASDTTVGTEELPGPHAVCSMVDGSGLRTLRTPREAGFGTKRPAPGCAWAPDRSMH